MCRPLVPQMLHALVVMLVVLVVLVVVRFCQNTPKSLLYKVNNIHLKKNKKKTEKHC